MFGEPDWFHHNGKGRLVPRPIDKEQEELVLLDNYEASWSQSVASKEITPIYRSGSSGRFHMSE